MPVSQPDVTINIIPAQTEISNEPQRVLFVGQQTSAATATSGALTQNIQNNSEEDTLYGENSALAGMIRAAKELNQITRMDAIGLDDNGGAVAATGDVTFVGTATESGVITVIVGSELNHKFEVSVADTDTATTIGAALASLITADTKAPITAANVAGVVTLTAVNAGLVGNFIAIKVTGAVAGVTTTIGAMSGGTTNPTLTNVFDVVGDTRYQTVIWPGVFATTELNSFLGDRFNVTNDVLDGVGFQTVTDTFANLQTLGNTEDTQTLVIIANKVVSETLYEGSAILELDDVITSQFGALRSKRLTKDANIANIVIATNGARDSFGGAAIASLPYFNTPFRNLPLIETGKGFTNQEAENLKTAGISRIGPNTAGRTMIADEIVTTYKTNAAGNPDPTFKFLNNVDTPSGAREFFFNNLKARFAQSRLTAGDVLPNRNMANQAVIEAVLDGFYLTLT
ncbi:MAG TPA: hypothetical protein ENH85_00720, partial [Candidatus Scalindua sp.]|nr:hypothetical protein [Candidatus Scalindua sp.]